MVGHYNQGVPTLMDIENNSNQKKYTVNHSSSNGYHISKPLCALMVLGSILLAVLAGLVVFFILPRCSESSLTPRHNEHEDLIFNEIGERLPRNLEPLSYRIKLVPNIENETTSGTVTIALNTLEDTNDIIFHVNKINISEDTVNLRSYSDNGKSLEIREQSYLEGQRYKVTAKETLKKGEHYSLEIQFTGELNKQLQGFYKSEYYDLTTHTNGYAISTQFSPTDARRAFPCFDEPSFKSNFTISIARPGNMSTLSNMPLFNTEIYPDKQNYFWDHYPETPKMPTYLVAFIISDLKSAPPQDALIKIWSRNRFLYQTDYAAKAAPKILRFFEKYFSIPFPLSKIDIVAVPEFGFSAMENWGLITFRESSLLFDNFSSTVEDKKSTATILSHEIAHQWFGNLVTPKWWNDLWLKEGFATYLQYLGVDSTEPRWKIIEEFVTSETLRAFAMDSLESSRPISFEVKNSQQIRQTFDEISYAKGACIIRMMNHFLGEDTFKRGLINYLNKYQYGNADRTDLFEALTEEAHRTGALKNNETVKDIMDTWTEQPGFPVITVQADYANKKLTVSQNRFLFTSSQEHKSKWWIPVSMTTDKETKADSTPKFWLRNDDQVTVDFDVGQWYLLNMNQTGYFIVNYDAKNWRSLLKNFMSLPYMIRAQLISDGMDLAKANLLEYNIPLKMIGKMARNDPDIWFVPHTVAFNKLKFLSDMLAETPLYGLFEEFHMTVYKNIYERVDLDDTVDDYLTRRIRLMVLDWSCRASGSLCSHTALEAFRNLMTINQKIKPNLRSIFYCTAIREGTEVEWEYAYDRYLETTSPSEKNLLLDALGCTRQRWLLSRYLDIMIHARSSIRIQDADRVFESVARNKFGNSIAFDFLRKNWDELVNLYGDGFGILSKMIKSVAAHMNTEFQLSELERFKATVNSNASATNQAFDSAIETVRGNVQWMNKNYDYIEKWLNTNKLRNFEM